MSDGVFHLDGDVVHPTVLARVTAAADFGNGISWVLTRKDGYRFINPDLTIHLHRHPIGEWIALESETLPDPLGVGLARAASTTRADRSVAQSRAC